MGRKRNGAADANKVVGLVRVSKEEQSLSPEAQRESMARWCAANGAELMAVHEDIDVSGGTPLAKRPGLLAALADLKRHGAGVLLVAKRDRLSRDPMVTAMAESAAGRVGARVVSVAGEGTENDDPASILMRRMIDAFAEYERLIIAARTRDALAVKRARGQRVGSVPYGFRLADDGTHLEPDEPERRIVALVRRYRGDGLALRAIGERLTRKGILPRSGGPWHPQTVARIAEAA